MALLGKIMVIKIPVTSELLVSFAQDKGITAAEVTEEMLRESFDGEGKENMGDNASLEFIEAQ